MTPFLQPSLNEILAQSSDENESHGASAMDETPGKKSETPKPPKRRQGLAAELESAASVSGLSRHSRKLVLGEGYESSSDDDLPEPPGRRVRFADEPAISGKKRKRPTSGLEPNTFLVEDAEDEVLDLADPDSLARHMMVASSAQVAKRAHIDRKAGLLGRKERIRLTSLSAFPMRDGRLVIDDNTSAKHIEQDGE